MTVREALASLGVDVDADAAVSEDGPYLGRVRLRRVRTVDAAGSRVSVVVIRD